MKKKEYADVSFIMRSPQNQKIMQCLNESKKPLIPRQIGKKAGMASSNVSTKLKGLRERKLVECINPNDRKWRFYRITDYGKSVLEMAEKTKEQ